MPKPTASAANRAQANDRRPLAIGLTLVAIAGTLLAWLMVWQAWQDFRLLRNQHQIQVEESVWAMAEQLGVNLTLRSSAAEHILDQARPAEGVIPDSLKELMPGVRALRHVTLDSPLIDQPLASWMPTLRHLRLTNQPYAVDFDSAHGLVYWLIAGRNPGEYWIMSVPQEVISSMIWSYPASGFSWLIEDAGRVRVLARQASGQLLYVDEAALTADERERVAVSAPVEGTLWQVRGLIDEGYYESRLGRLIITKALIVAGFVAVLLVAVWLVARMQYANRRLAYRSARSREGLVEAERRYRDIFQSVGMALCQLDLSDLREHLERLGLHSAADLDRWLASVDSHAELLQRIRVVDANRNTLDLLALGSVQELEDIFQADEPIRKGGARYGLMLALINRQERLEMETPMRTARGTLRYVWIVMRLPDDLADYCAVTMSISDITARRQVELTMIERERFWSGVVKAVPDIVFIKDMQRNEFVFSNRSLAQALGYSPEEEAELGAGYRDKLIHPDDLEYVRVNRNLQQVLPDGKLLDWRLRWRRRDGSWHWFNVRMKVLSRLPDGRVHQLIGIVKNVHQQTQMTERLKTGEQRYRLLAENISDVIWATDEAFQLNYVSPSVKRMLGYEPEFIINSGFVEVVAGTRFNRFMGAMLRELRPLISSPDSAAQLWREGFHRQTTIDCIKADGRTIPVELRVSLMWDPSGRFLGLLGIARDITEQRRTENRLRMAATVFENTTGAIFVTDPAGYIVQVNDNFTQITGFDSTEVIDQTPQLFASGVHEKHFYRDVLAELRREGRWEGEVWQKRKNGEIFPSWAGITAVQDNDGDLVSYVCFFVDISERKASEARIESLAYYDALTGLPNRALFQERLSSALKLAGRRDEWVVVLFLDLDRFKPINDTMGHAAGDAMLKEVGKRLQRCIRESDTVARMGGDEFTMLLAGLSSRESAMRAGISVAEKILERLAPAFVLQDREFFISASIGIALYPQDGSEGSLLLQNADTAMYHAKSAGKDTFQFYQAEMNARALERLSLENDLRKAVHEDAFTLHFQPQFGCISGELTGVEALLRWHHPKLGWISPALFIPVAEEIGLVSALGDWVLDRACRQMAEWHSDGYAQPRMAINLSGRQFAEGKLAERVARVIQRHALQPACIELELTESILLRDVGETMQTLAQLKELGVHIAVDDFGTGYSSLNYLKDFPIDTLKIDRSFIQAMHAGSRDARLAEAIVAMGRSLQLIVIAEGVETVEQLDLLRSFGCDEVQGFYLGKPMSAEELRDRYLRPA